MNEKLKIILLIIIFIVILVGINLLLDSQNNTSIESNQYIYEGGESMGVIEVSDENFKSEVLESDKTVLIDFYADWCGPCKMLSPVVEEVAKENDNIKVVKINLDNSQDIAVEYGIMSIPTLVVIKNGQETNRSIGVISKSEITKLLEE